MQGSRFLFLAFFFLFTACSATAPAGREPSSVGPREQAMARLRAKGMSEAFLNLLDQTYEEKDRARVLELNILGFLKARPQQDERIPRWELEKVRKFLVQNRKVFRKAAQKYPVPREVIASLLWVETKHGKDLGRFHVASSFFSLAQADYPTLVDQTLDRAKELNGGKLSPEIEQKVAERSRIKAEWASNELMALQELHQKGWKNATSLRGSFSGAFGMAQFVPSSYATWARGQGEKANLFDASDSILSVANYLSAQGWKRKDEETQRAALFHYNRDINYVNRILRMSSCLRGEPRMRAKDEKDKAKDGKERKVASGGRWC